MKFLKKYEAYLDNVRKWYIILFIAYLLLSRVVLFVNIVTIPVNSMIYNLFAATGALLLVWDFFTNFYQFKSKENLLLLGFFIVCGISSLLNMEYGLSSNLKTLVWTAIQFFILFSTLHIKDKGYIRQVLGIIMKFMTVVWFVTTVISLVQFLFVVKYKAPFSSYPRRQGFVDSRLFGVYSDPNFAAVTSLVVIIFAIFLCKNTTSKLFRRFQIANIICQILYIVLSGSRTGQIELAVLFFMLGFIFIRNKSIKNGKKAYMVKASGVAVALAVVAILCVKILPQPLISIATVGENIKKELFYSDTGNDDDGDNQNSEDKDDELDDDELDDEPITLDREDIKEDNVSNNRFEIWSSAVEVSGDSRLFGVSPRNLVSYAQANYPESYIATSGYETHNGYVAVFVCTGIAGTAVMLAFVGYMAYLLIKYVRVNRHKPYGDELIIAVSTVIVIAISAVMLLDIFFVNTVSAALFWLMAGYFVYIVKQEIKTKSTEKDVIGK